MLILKDKQCEGHERVVSCQDDSVGLRAIIAIHSTVLGPALGGVRMWPYASSEEALQDVLRLAQAMTYKAAVAGLPRGPCWRGASSRPGVSSPTKSCR